MTLSIPMTTSGEFFESQRLDKPYKWFVSSFTTKVDLVYLLLFAGAPEEGWALFPDYPTRF